MKHKGSISCKHLSFATLIYFHCILLIQSVLLSVKRVKLRELVGEVEEEEPEGEIVAGPSDEATSHNSGITHSLFLWLLIHAYTYIHICVYIDIHIHLYVLFFAHPTPELLPSFSWTDVSTDEETGRPKTKEEGDVETLCSWMEVGWFPARPDEEAQGLLIEVNSNLPSFLVSSATFFVWSATPSFPFLPFILQGLNFLKRSSSLHEVAQHLEREVWHLETEG